MYTRTLRKTIANLFPDRYRYWSWKNLLAAFVDSQLKNLTRQWLQYHKQGEALPQEPEPALSTELYQAMTLLAKRQKLSYAFLAMSHFQQLHQFGALAAENQRLTQLNESLLANGLANLARETRVAPAEDALRQTLGLDLIERSVLQQRLISLIQSLDQTHQQQLDAYYEAQSDDPTQELVKPEPPAELTAAITLQALLDDQTFASLACQVFCQNKSIKALQWEVNFIRQQWLGEKEQNLTLQGLVLELGDQLMECKESHHPDQRLN